MVLNIDIVFSEFNNTPGEVQQKASLSYQVSDYSNNKMLSLLINVNYEGGDIALSKTSNKRTDVM